MPDFFKDKQSIFSVVGGGAKIGLRFVRNYKMTLYNFDYGRLDRLVGQDLLLGILGSSKSHDGAHVNDNLDLLK